MSKKHYEQPIKLLCPQCSRPYEPGRFGLLQQELICHRQAKEKAKDGTYYPCMGSLKSKVFEAIWELGVRTGEKQKQDEIKANLGIST